MSARLVRRLAVATALATTVGVAALPSGAATARSTADLRVGSYNIIAGSSVATFDKAVRAVLPRVDVAGFQEVNSRDKKDKLRALSSDGWGYHRPGPGAQEPVVWRTDRFAFVSSRDVKVSEATYIGNEKPGPSTQREKYVTVVRLQDRESGQNISVINVHLVSGAVKGGKFYVDRPRLAALYSTQVNGVESLVDSESQWGQVFVLGDFNVGFVMDNKYRVSALPVATFGNDAMQSMWAYGRPSTDLGTRGTALLDQVYSGLPSTGNSIAFDIKFSDHFPAIAKYAVPVTSS